MQKLRTTAKMSMLKITFLNTQPPGSGNGSGGPFWLSSMSSCTISHYYYKKKKLINEKKEMLKSSVLI